jgi:hypothetical protein
MSAMTNDAASTASTTPILSIEAARATIRLNRTAHLNRIEPEDITSLNDSTGSRRTQRSGSWC